MKCIVDDSKDQRKIFIIYDKPAIKFRPYCIAHQNKSNK